MDFSQFFINYKKMYDNQNADTLQKTARQNLLSLQQSKGDTQLLDIKQFNGVSQKSQNINKQEPLKDIQIKNKFIPIISSLILSISSFQFGMSFCQITAVPTQTLINAYKIPLSPGYTNSILVGLIPIGAILGCLMYTLVLKFLSRRHSLYFTILLNLISYILIEVPTFETIVISRFIQGITVGLYTSIGPLCIRQISPKQMKGLLGSFFSLGRAVGNAFAFLIGVILYEAKCPQYYRIVFSVTAIFAIIQAIGIFFFVPDSPIELFQKGKEEQLRKVLQNIYAQHSVDIVYKQIQTQFLISQARKDKQQNQQQDLKPNKRRAFAMACYLNIFRNFCGINAIAVYAGLIIQNIDLNLSIYAGIIINGIALIVVIISTFFVANNFGRRILWLTSQLILGIFCIAVGIGYVFNQQIVVFVFIILYIIIFGLMLSPVLWLYPGEIIPPSQIGITVMLTWVALAIAVIVPPIVIESMPDQNPYPIFFFFGGYLLLSLFYLFPCMVQSKGLTYQQIIQKF